MEIVVPVRREERSESLRYCLRAVEAHVPHTRVLIVGHVPDWYVGESIRTVQFGNKWRNTDHNLRIACAEGGLGEWFWLWNDDFFALEPVKAIPPMHLGLLEAHWRAYVRRHSDSGYTAGLGRALVLLRDLGIEDPLSWEAHAPMPVPRDTLAQALEVCAARNDPRLPERTIAGNLAGLGGIRITDPKVDGPGDPLPPGAWASTNAASWAGRAGAWIRAAFPRPSRHEKPGR